jgi:hypothetical protein
MHQIGGPRLVLSRKGFDSRTSGGVSYLGLLQRLGIEMIRYSNGPTVTREPVSDTLERPSGPGPQPLDAAPDGRLASPVRPGQTPPGAKELPDDHTAFDAFITYTTSTSAKGFLGVETKYTEPFSPKSFRPDHYEQLLAGGGHPPDRRPRPRSWRNRRSQAGALGALC